MNGGYQFTTNNFTDGAVKHQNANGRTTPHSVSGPSFDVAGGARVWRRLSVSVGVSRFSVLTPVSVAATIPHPFFFNRLRSINGEAPGLKRDELTLDVQARGVFPIGIRVEAMVFGGPSFFQVKQGVVTDFTYTESYPYDVAQFGAATATNASVSKMGFNVGGDIAFFFTRNIGVGPRHSSRERTSSYRAPVGRIRRSMSGVRAGGGRACDSSLVFGLRRMANSAPLAQL